ncbi:estrogen sulfotransferase-like isoform X1 [Dendronephthya gigantea]|uniref:estrogen sulfotransferase-like isoform X1 n=1 Tax=Dendronephthya gigantea TaxID=151771 RepID=UPI001069334A|nr:estrogen sulfotransferase-like isoform X1 [Dendronephthya gigantea]
MSSEKTPAAGSPEIQLYKQRASKFYTKHGRLHGLNFKPRPDDVFVVTPPKCGTTWMQQILHQLRSGGDMSFDEITDVVPYLEAAYDTERDLEAEHNFQPRCYKTHAWYPDCPKGAKYIVIYREPCASFSSFYNFLKGWFFQPGEISLQEFVKEIELARGEPKSKMESASYFVHLMSWWEHRNDPNVLFLFFEDMKDDLESAVRKVASFIGIEDDERIKKAVEMSSFEFMKSNERKFSEYRTAKYRNKFCGIPDDVVPSKVVTGSATKGREMMDEKTKEMIHAKWNEVVWKQIGFQDYQQLRNAFKKQNENE